MSEWRSIPDRPEYEASVEGNIRRAGGDKSLPPITETGDKPDAETIDAATGEVLEGQRAEAEADPDLWPLYDHEGRHLDHLAPEPWLEAYEGLTRKVQSIAEGKALREQNMGSIRKLPDNRTPRVTNAENAARARLKQGAEQPSMLDA